MGKKLFVLLVVLMSLSLIGIIFVQSFFINNSLENEDKNFTRSVKHALSFVSNDIEEMELRNYVLKIQPFIENNTQADSTVINQLFITTEDDINDKTIVHRNTVYQERYKIPSLFLEIDVDSFNINKLSNERVTEFYNNSSIDGKRSIAPEKQLIQYSSMPELQKQMYEDSFKDHLIDIPINRRITPLQVKSLLRFL